MCHARPDIHFFILYISTLHFFPPDMYLVQYKNWSSGNFGNYGVLKVLPLAQI